MEDAHGGADVSIFLARLGRHGRLGAACRTAIAEAATIRALYKGERLIHEGERLDGLAVLCGGLALKSRHLSGGAQQHLALHVPGEMLHAKLARSRKLRADLTVQLEEARATLDGARIVLARAHGAGRRTG